MSEGAWASFFPQVQSCILQQHFLVHSYSGTIVEILAFFSSIRFRSHVFFMYITVIKLTMACFIMGCSITFFKTDTFWLHIEYIGGVSPSHVRHLISSWLRLYLGSVTICFTPDSSSVVISAWIPFTCHHSNEFHRSTNPRAPLLTPTSPASHLQP